jgi:hypothetical protein
MSASSLTTLAAVRDSGVPKKGDLGKAANEAKKDEKAGITDILVSFVPTEFVAPYTLVVTAIVGAIAKPTRKNLHPDQLEGWRWCAFAVIVAAVGVWVWLDKRRKAGGGRFPLLEVGAGMIATAGWALAMPGNPLDPHLNGNEKQFVPIVIGFVAVVIEILLAKAAQKPRG